MLEFEIILPSIKDKPVKYPFTISEDDLLAALLSKKGKAIELIKKFIKEAKKDDSDIVHIKLKEINELLTWSYEIKKPDNLESKQGQT